MSDLLDVAITNANSVGGKNPYTIYELKVSSSITASWIILKRFRDFVALNQQLTSRITSDPDLKKGGHRLPEMPRKKKFGSMKPSVVAKRQRELELYTKTLLQNQSLRRADLLLDFLNVPEAVRQMILIQTPRRRHTTPEHDDKYEKKRQHMNEDELEVDILLKKLYQQKDRVKALQRFEEWYYLDRPDIGNNGISMHPHLIRKLLKGYDRYPGLIQSCKLSHCKTAWRGSLSLLCKLMDVERNKYARMFIQVFLNLDHSLYREMDLHRHIKDSTQEDGFQIVALIHEGLPRLDPTVYVSDAESWIQYLKWSKIQHDSYIVGINYEPEEIEKENEIFNVNLYKQIEEKKKDDIGKKKNNDNNNNKYQFNYNKLSKEIFERYEDFAYESDEEYRYIHKINEKYSGISMQVRCKKDFYNDHWKLKISFVINHEPSVIYEYLRMSYVGSDNPNKNAASTNGWDKKLIDRRTVTKLDNDNFIMHEVYKSFNSPYKFRDFVVLRHFRKQKLNDNGNERYFIICSSVSNYHKMPESADKLRCIIYPSGFEIRPYNNLSKKSLVSYRLHLTSESVNIITADLLGECDELFQSMLRIYSLVTSYKHKLKMINKITNDVNRPQLNALQEQIE